MRLEVPVAPALWARVMRGLALAARAHRRRSRAGWKEHHDDGVRRVRDRE